MAIYVIGDIQGCYAELEQLLAQTGFTAEQDVLWLVGDLINRGRQSLEVLRFVKNLGDRAVSVLGNHDLHCLAVACGYGRIHRQDTLDELLNAPDRDELLDWLRHRPLLHHDERLGLTMIHAGLPPQWDLDLARQCAAEVEQALRGPDPGRYFASMYGNNPDRWSDNLQGPDRLRFITNCLTRLRYLDHEGGLSLAPKGPIGTQPVGCEPWFRMPGRKTANDRIIFGHWSTLGLYQQDNVIGLDSGCLWGGELTALQVDADTGDIVKIWQHDCPGQLIPHVR